MRKRILFALSSLTLFILLISVASASCEGSDVMCTPHPEHECKFAGGGISVPVTEEETKIESETIGVIINCIVPFAFGGNLE